MARNQLATSIATRQPAFEASKRRPDSPRIASGNLDDPGHLVGLAGVAEKHHLAAGVLLRDAASPWVNASNAIAYQRDAGLGRWPMKVAVQPRWGWRGGVFVPDLGVCGREKEQQGTGNARGRKSELHWDVGRWNGVDSGAWMPWSAGR